MDLENVFVCDIETDGFLEDVTKLHVFGASVKNKEGKWEVHTTNNRDRIVKLFSDPDKVIVGHNFWLYDVPVLEKLYDFEVKATIIDTLWIAWNLFPNRIMEGKKYGLESFGEDYGVPKPVITDWENLTYEEYENRVSEDVKINTNLWIQILNTYEELYEGDWGIIKRHIRFLMANAFLYYVQQNNPLQLDVERVKSELEKLEGLKGGKIEILSAAMPKVAKKAKRKPPSKPYKKDNSLSATGMKWKRLTDGCNLPFEYDGIIEEITGYDDPNPSSVSQVKDWLFSLGWKPEIYNDTVRSNGEPNKVPQTLNKKKELCNSVKKLIEKEPAIQALDDLGVISHRIGILKGFLRDKNDRNEIIGSVAGLTNTCRIRHKILVNLPKPSAPYAEGIRASLLPPKGTVMIGSDLSGIESVTRNAFIKPYDPEYVRVMEEDKYYDAHLDIALVADMLTVPQVIFYKYWKEKYKNDKIKPEDFNHPMEGYQEYFDGIEDKDSEHSKLDKIRASAKTTNYAALYGIGAAKLCKELKITKSEAQRLLDAFWERNKSVLQFSDSCETKEIRGQMWVKNPLNNYWYSLRDTKNIFSVANQSSAAYIHTLNCYTLLKSGVKINFTAHDELVTFSDEKGLDKIVKLLYKSIESVQKNLSIHIALGIDYKTGKSYAEVH